MTTTTQMTDLAHNMIAMRLREAGADRVEWGTRLTETRGHSSRIGDPEGEPVETDLLTGELTCTIATGREVRFGDTPGYELMSQVFVGKGGDGPDAMVPEEISVTIRVVVEGANAQYAWTCPEGHEYEDAYPAALVRRIIRITGK